MYNRTLRGFSFFIRISSSGSTAPSLGLFLVVHTALFLEFLKRGIIKCMETRFRTSFVPKKALAVKTEAVHGGTIHLFLAIGVLAFVLSLLGAGGVYAYKTFLEKSVQEKSIALEKAKKAFEPGFIEDAKILSTRIAAARELSAKHTVVSPVFDLLGETTLTTVRFTDFSLSNALGLGTAVLTLKGEARGSNSASGYASVALQSDAFGENEKIREPVFSALKLSEKGLVQFSFTSGLDPQMFLYSKTFAPESETFAPSSADEILPEGIFPAVPSLEAPIIGNETL